ncbi:MAG TPA: methyltransferase domain-containing protein, partial [Candidatus Omnitrophota bacterium]|nr:methyltransferase domain-containing protein [Candidatus Omnitrophota bacterium]
MIDFTCPECRTVLIGEAAKLRCDSCRREYLIRDGIPDFRKRDDYWCNVSREKMRLLNKRAEESGDWLAAAKEIVPQYMEHFVGFNRADAQFIWPVDKGARILDAGSMWGGLTIPAAQYAKEVVAIDKTVETLSFLGIRARQMGIRNIQPVASTLDKLPLPDNYFDLVVLNGVLEWVAFGEDLILEKHWNGRMKDVRRYTKGPTQMQIDVLKEIQRVTRPGGYIFLAIENRSGYQYLTGHPDDHVNLPFVTFLPRFAADMITRLLRGHSYRTYVYSQKGCANILSKSGYNQTKFYAAFPH